MNSESVDLVYLDPPFNKKRNFAAPIGSKAAVTAFKDSWTWDDVDRIYLGLLRSKRPALHAVIYSALLAHDKGMAAYLSMMAQRLEEMHRLLKPAGSVYLHCDPTASHYLKQIMDVIYGYKNCRNEIVWRRTGSHNSTRSFGRIHDTIFCYHKASRYKFNIVRTPYMKGHVERRYTAGPDGRMRFSSGGNVLTGEGATDGPSCEPWRGFDPEAKGRHWAIPRFYEELMDASYRDLAPVEKLEALYQNGHVEIKVGNAWPIMVRFLEERDGVPLSDIWACQPYTEGTVWNTEECIEADVQWLGPTDPERVSYPTQKPLSLLGRILRASSDEDDVVMDPFCGCATTCVAAEQLSRQWVGIDISHKAADLVVSRLDQAVYDHAGVQTRRPDVVHRTDLPRRTDLGRLPRYTAHKATLYGEGGGYCGGCGVHFEKRNLTVDHIVPTSKGGTGHPENLWLLCGACNSSKGTRSQAEFIRDRMSLQGAAVPWLEGA